MKIVLSPAKSLDFDSKLPTSKFTQPVFLNEAEKLISVLEKKSKSQLKDLMGISDNLAELNYKRYKDFKVPFTEKNARPAIYAFSGDVYVGLDAYALSKGNISTLQDTVRILSGLYGVLKPLDLMQPYRLEMGTDLKVNRKKNLYEFWGDQITEALNEELKDDELFVNLASKEYFKSVNEKKLKVPVISPEFKDFKNGKLKIISFYAKKARGSMARYMVENKIDNYEGILKFNWEGYSFSEKETKNNNKPVFIR
tara:strand:- start:37670 stop:38431 length:762 start_codon:yes stop_codon:yes gene_type:complete